MSTISVIVPIYNAELYLHQCITSLIHQTHYQLQIILVNDGSTDQSYSIAKQFAEQDPRIELHTQSNKGQSAARNLGLQHATGEFVSFIDADDYLDTNFYHELLTQISDKDCIQIGYRRVHQNGKLLYKKLPKTFYHFTSPCMRMYRRAILTSHSLSFPEGMIYEDVIFSIDLWCTNPTYKIINYTGYNYTVNTHSTTSKRNQEAEYKVFSALFQRFKKCSTLRNKCIILFTIIRLKLHFIRYDK